MSEYTLDTPLADLELSVRSANVLKTHGCVTLRDAAEKLDDLKRYARGFGVKGYREIKEIIAYASQEQGDLLEETAYRRHVLESRLTAIQALMQDVSRGLVRAALMGHMNAEVRRHMAFKLRDAANYIEQLPTLTEG